jgi:protease-4
MNFWKTFLAALLGCLVAMILNLILFFMLIGALMSAGASSESIPTVKNGSILKIDLSEAIGERTQEGVSADLGIPFLSMPKASLGIYDAIRSIEKAAEDNRVSMILITDKGTVNSGLSNLEELRNALVKFHDCGKPIVAYGINYSLGGYYVASVADKVYIHNEGLMPIQGLGASMMFFKDALDKLGVEFQLIRHGKFKAAAEQYIKNDISPENRQQNMEMLNSIWECFSEAICKSRNLDPQVLNDAIDNLKIGTAKSAKEFNLVDETLTTDEYSQKICGLVGVEKEEDLNVITISNYAKSLGNKLKGDKKIAVLYAEGEIAMNGSGIAATKFVREVEKIRKDDKIDAVVFRVNSPGGDAQAAELMREALQKLAAEKPIVCSFGEYAASGGYWISAQAKHIFSDKTTLTGSIGVFSLAFNYAKGLKEHLKINAVQLGTHKHATAGDLSRPMDEEEQAYTQTFIEQIYTKFMNIVSDGRNMTVAQVDSIAQGRVWTGTQGVQVGIVDEIGGIEDAIKYTANLVNASDYQVVEYPRVKTQMEMMMESFSGSGEETLLKKIFGKKNVSQAEQILKDIEENNGVKTYVRMPYNYEFSY